MPKLLISNRCFLQTSMFVSFSHEYLIPLKSERAPQYNATTMCVFTISRKEEEKSILFPKVLLLPLFPNSYIDLH